MLTVYPMGCKGGVGMRLMNDSPICLVFFAKAQPDNSRLGGECVWTSLIRPTSLIPPLYAEQGKCSRADEWVIDKGF